MEATSKLQILTATQTSDWLPLLARLKATKWHCISCTLDLNQKRVEWVYANKLAPKNLNKDTHGVTHGYGTFFLFSFLSLHMCGKRLLSILVCLGLAAAYPSAPGTVSSCAVSVVAGCTHTSR